MTGSFARTSPQAEGSRPQGWISAPAFATIVLLVAFFLHIGLAGVLPPKVFLILLVVVVIVTALWIDATPT